MNQYRFVDGAYIFSTFPPAPRSPAPFLLSCHKIGRPHDEQRIQDKERTGGHASHSFCQHLRRKLHKGCGVHTRKVKGKACWVSRRRYDNSTGCITSKHYIYVMSNVAPTRTLAPQFYNNNIDNHFKHTFLGKPVRIFRILDAVRQAYYSGENGDIALDVT